VRQFVREGYHHVPDWTDLAFIARADSRKGLPRQRHCRDRERGGDRKWHVQMSGPGTLRLNIAGATDGDAHARYARRLRGRRWRDP
jgi:hypothetical protein